MTRVLRERAFWDIYYEHCTYLTAGSLARLFRSTGFEIVELVRDFADQYLWITARPVDERTVPRLPIEDDLETTANEVARFREEGPKDVAAWRDRIRAYAAEGRKPVLWGAGSKAVALLTSCGLSSEIERVVDINPHKVGKFLPGAGHVVSPPESLRDYQPDVVVAMNGVYTKEIGARLSGMDVHAEIVPL